MNLRKTAVCAALVLALTQAVQAEVSLKSEGKLCLLCPAAAAKAHARLC